MEMLATLVLNGEGSRLIGRYSDNSELQAFLENVPTYMHKINRIHVAARQGDIKDLQAALDRRKFAIARDPISPNGSTPLHVATVFGKTNIVKYLGGRFPETLSAVDFEGRTALHYAAVLPDNGHYYHVLQQLGANTKDLDDNGVSAEDYYKNPRLLPLSQLFKDFGISEETAKEMFSDKETSAGNGHLDIPIFHTEEGRYLAKSLGDPLIKGLTEVANVKPKDPIAFLATFLHNFPEGEKPRLGTQEAELENEHAPYNYTEDIKEEKPVRSATLTTTRPNKPIEVITIEPKDETTARTHTNNALFQLLQETDVSLGYRDELYRTARDISIQANLSELLLQGYDHILDVVDENNVPITELESREKLHGAIKRGDLKTVQDLLSKEGGRTLARAQNALGRTSLHIAVLIGQEEIVSYLAQNFPELLRTA
ncbi:unnamed protein product [Leptidea sinapis]|uniref:Death domain-containing protein n=1 Tax=Leptidea sinapis TaxID=189913 RepID=A0A5E4Q4H0_9NEOP|nr:unnamed protein product [Leptidea sinapis]